MITSTITNNTTTTTTFTPTTAAAAARLPQDANPFQNTFSVESTNEPAPFCLVWRNLNFVVQGTTLLGVLEPNRKHVLNRSGGEFRCGQLSALMGPSGCGKSSLLACLSGRKRHGVSGELQLITGKGQTPIPVKQIRTAFIPQFDQQPEKLTARECLMFSARLKQHQRDQQIRVQSSVNQPTGGHTQNNMARNGTVIKTSSDNPDPDIELISSTIVPVSTSSSSSAPTPPPPPLSTESQKKRDSFFFPNKNKQKISKPSNFSSQKLKKQTQLVNVLLNELQLEHVADRYVSQLSGGQRRRLSIGQELTGIPDILFLDEPTTGLDSSAAYSCIRLLRACAHGRSRALNGVINDNPNEPSQRRKILVVVSIHQPTERTLALFDWLHVVGMQARAVYRGLPMQLLSHLEKLELNCPPDQQPIEFLLEQVSHQGSEATFQRLQHNVAPIAPTYTLSNHTRTQPLRVILRNQKPPLSVQVPLLLKRQLITMRRSWLALAARFGYFILLAFLTGTIFPPEASNYTNCPDLDSTIGFMSGNLYEPQSFCGRPFPAPYEPSTQRVLTTKESSPVSTDTATVASSTARLTQSENRFPMFNVLNFFDNIFNMSRLFPRKQRPFRPEKTSNYIYNEKESDQRTRMFGNQLARNGFVLIALILGAMLPLLIALPAELSLLQREQANGDCSVLGSLLAKWLSELPLQIICPIVFAGVADFWLPDFLLSLRVFDPTLPEPMEQWRLVALTGVYVLISLLAALQATCIGGWAAPSLTAALLLGPLSFLPMLLFSGIFVRTQIMPTVLQFLANFSYLRNALQLTIHCVYGLGRCEQPEFGGDGVGNQIHCDLGHLRSLAKGFAELMDLLQQVPIFKASLVNTDVDSVSVPLVNSLIDLGADQRISSLIYQDKPSVQSFVFQIFDMNPDAVFWDILWLLVNLAVYALFAFWIIFLKIHYFSK